MKRDTTIFKDHEMTEFRIPAGAIKVRDETELNWEHLPPQAWHKSKQLASLSMIVTIQKSCLLLILQAIYDCPSPGVESWDYVTVWIL